MKKNKIRMEDLPEVELEKVRKLFEKDRSQETKKSMKWEGLTSTLQDRKAIILSTSEVGYISRLSIIFYTEGLLQLAKTKKWKNISLKHLRRELREQVDIQKKVLEV